MVQQNCDASVRLKTDMMFTYFALVFGLFAVASAAGKPEDSNIPLPIFDHYSNNSLNLHQLSTSFGQQGFVNLRNFDFVYGHYGENNPVLMVIKPDHSLEELHGYYFPKGFSSFTTYGGKDYDFIRQYFRSNQFEGYTPYAVRFTYPYFLDFKMTKFIHGNEPLLNANVVFLVPKVNHSEDFVTSFLPIVALIPK